MFAFGLEAVGFNPSYASIAAACLHSLDSGYYSTRYCHQNLLGMRSKSDSANSQLVHAAIMTDAPKRFQFKTSVAPTAAFRCKFPTATRHIDQRLAFQSDSISLSSIGSTRPLSTRLLSTLSSD
jgi:hypothetical protein